MNASVKIPCKDGGYVLVWKSRDGWRWHKNTANHRIVSDSGEAYTRRWRAVRAAKRFAKTE